ncbi:MAG TPA: hypothetical protein VLA00_15610 [Xanthobacteraceae bacterium]|nr:hypothetical protein [Xanthobacteraceae bacterium]
MKLEQDDQVAAEAGLAAGEPEVQTPPADAPPTPDAVRAALGRVLAADELKSSPQLSTFLRFVVAATLEGRAEAIKGYTIAVEALGRDASFDPQIDPIVRVEATRLRRALERYYAGAGAADEIEIAVPRGSYVPCFIRRGAAPPQVSAPAAEEAPAWSAVPPAAVPASPRRPRSRILAAAAMAVLGIALLAGYAAESLGWPGMTAGTAMRPVDRANHLGMPMVEVRAFETAGGTAGAADFDPKALEVRVRDALARYDLLDVLATPDARPAVDCSSGSARPHSAFALGGMVEHHEDGTVAVLLRLADVCDGTIVWSREFESLKYSADPTIAELGLVRDIMAAIAEPYGVIQSRARARAAAAGGVASAGPYGCVLMAFGYWRSFLPAEHARARDCLEKAVAADSGFSVGYALLAELYLDELRNGANPQPGLPLDRALAAAEQAVELEPTSSYARRVLLDVHFFRGERGAAIAAGEAAVVLNPYDVDVAADFGGRLVAFGETARGEALLSSVPVGALGMPPWAEYHRVIAAYVRGDAPAAEAAADEMIGDLYAPGLLARVLAHHLAGESEAAAADVRKLVAAAPDWATDTRAMVAHFFPDPALAARVRADLAAAGLTGTAATLR